VAAKLWSGTKVALQLTAGVLVMIAIGDYGSARNQGKIPDWVDELVNVGWGVGIVLAAFILARWSERHYIGHLPRHKFSPAPSEKMLFSGNFMSCRFYLRPEEFGTNHGAWRRMLTVRLTDRCLALGSVLGSTWRIIPLPYIRCVSEPRDSRVNRNTVLIEYELEGRSEAFLIWNKRTRGKDFAEVLETAMQRARSA